MRSEPYVEITVCFQLTSNKTWHMLLANESPRKTCHYILQVYTSDYLNKEDAVRVRDKLAGINPRSRGETGRVGNSLTLLCACSERAQNLAFGVESATSPTSSHGWEYIPETAGDSR